MKKFSAFFQECSGVLESRFEVACIFEKVFGQEIHAFDRNLQVNGETEAAVKELVQKRKSGVPLQYLLGEWEFYGLPFKVGEGVLIPRQDTETLIEFVLERFSRVITKLKIADLCAGSGCIGITLDKLLENAEVFAVEKSPAAFRYLEENIKLNHSRVTAVLDDVLNPKTNLDVFDIIVSNPPYLTGADMENLQEEVRREPPEALNGGADGLYFYEGITKIWKNSLTRDGSLIFEVGINQFSAVKTILEKNNFKNVLYKEDYNGIIRIVSGVGN